MGGFHDTAANFTSVFSAIGLFLSFVVILNGSRWWKAIREYVHQKLEIVKFARTLPGPRGLPILGNILELWDPDETINTLIKIGCAINSRLFQFWIGPAVVKIVTSDPGDIQIALTSVTAAQKDDIYDLMQPAIINGLINAPTSLYHRAHKKLIMPQVNGNTVMSQYITQFNYQSRILVERLKNHLNVGEFNIQDLVSPCLCDIVFETLLGIKGTAQAGETNVFLTHTQICLHTAFYRMMRPWLYPDFIFRLTKRGREYFQLVKLGHEFVDKIIAGKKDKYKILDSGEAAKSCLLDFLIDNMMKGKQWTDKEIRYETITIFIGAYETMTSLTCFALLMIAMHPEVQEKAREEIKNVMRSDELCESEVANLSYLEMIVRETIRLYPIGPLLARKVEQDLTLATCTAPKGSSLFLLPAATHRDSEFWDEPEKFIPERFTPDISKKRHPYAYVPFSAGLRSCPGSKYGMIGIKVILAHVLTNCQLNTTMKMENIRLHNHISSCSADGYPVSLQKLQKSD